MRRYWVNQANQHFSKSRTIWSNQLPQIEQFVMNYLSPWRYMFLLRVNTIAVDIVPDWRKVYQGIDESLHSLRLDPVDLMRFRIIILFFKSPIAHFLLSNRVLNNPRRARFQFHTWIDCWHQISLCHVTDTRDRSHVSRRETNQDSCVNWRPVFVKAWTF